MSEENFELVPIQFLMEFGEYKNFDFTDEEFREYLRNLPVKNYFKSEKNIDPESEICACMVCEYAGISDNSLPCRACIHLNTFDKIESGVGETDESS